MTKLLFSFISAFLLNGVYSASQATPSLTEDELNSTKIEVTGSVSQKDFEDLIEKLGQPESKIENVSLHSASLASFPEDIFYSLGEAFCQNKSLTSLSITESGINDHFVAKICWALRTRPDFSLEILRLSFNPLYDRIGQSLGEALEINTKLRELFLDDVKLADEGVSLLAKALKKNSSLTLLSLSHNNIQDQGAGDLGLMLAFNTGLKDLNLAHNKITLVGVDFLFFDLSKNKSLSKLNLEFNKLENRDEGFSRLQDVSLKELNIGGNNLSVKALESLASALGKNTSLQILSLTHSGLNDDNFDKVIELVLLSENNLKSLDLSFNALADGAAFTLGSYLDDTRHLTSLDLRHNDITDAGVDDLIEALKKQKNVTSLMFADNDNISHEKSLALDTLLQDLAKASKAPTLSLVKQSVVMNPMPSTQLINEGDF